MSTPDRIFNVSQKMIFVRPTRLLAIALMLLVAGCASKAFVSTASPSGLEATINCLAEIVSVKREPWTVRLSSHIRADDVWQGPLSISLRLLGPADRAGGSLILGVYDEREISIDGRRLEAGDTIRFLASNSVLSRSIVPEVFSNLREVHRTPRTANQSPEPTPGSVTPRAEVPKSE